MIKDNEVTNGETGRGQDRVALVPSDFGLPAKFKEFRENQVETAAKITSSKKYAFLLDAPTGSGKSLIAAAVQKILGKQIVYLCVTKQLQEQLLADFPYAHTLKGRNNYPCLAHAKLWPEITAEDCSKSESNPCEHESKCPYIRAKVSALGAPIAVLNMAYFLSEANYVGTFSDLEFLCVDESDTLEDQLMSFIEVVITQRQLNELRLEPPKYKTRFESWVDWARSAISVLTPRLDAVHKELESDWSTIDFQLMREEKKLLRLVKKLSFFVHEVDKNWVWLPGEDQWTFKPVWIAKYAHEYLWKHTKRVLGMSATILDPLQMCVNTGLDFNNCVYKALPSPFPKENRPVYFQPVANVTSKNMEAALPALADAIFKIIEEHPNDKILIHTVTYKIRDYVMKRIRSNRLMTHDTFNRADVLEKFKRSEYPKALVSPSMDRGIDLPHDQCRVVVVAKAPFPDLGDAQISKRVHASKDGNRWYAHKTVGKIVQMCGRAVRSADDHAEMYILDSQFERLYRENRHMFPSWFQEAIIW